MKRKICVAAAVFASSLFLTACGSKEYLKDIKAEKYVTLGTYTGIEATVNKPEVPEARWTVTFTIIILRRKRKRCR